MLDDTASILLRLRAVLPARWFDSPAPVLDGLLSGLAAGWSWVYQLVAFAAAQTRVSTATGLWLDLASADYFGTRLARRAAESDLAYRARIQREMVRERGTRNAVISALTDLTGHPPVVFEPGMPADTGVWGFGIGYGQAGGWGSLDLPFQCFVTAYRPRANGVAQVAGWGVCIGAYGQGSIEYANGGMSQGQVTDEEIFAAVAGGLPSASIAWTRITN